MEANPAVSCMQDAYKDSGASLWILSPDLYKLAARQVDWGSNLAHRVVRPN